MTKVLRLTTASWLVMRGINPHDEIKGSISTPKGKEQVKTELGLIL
jgi:hypothetical protein